MISIIFFVAVHVLAALFYLWIQPSIDELLEAIREDGPDVEELA